MYERSRRSAKSPTNSVRCASERGCQWRAIERLAISPKSKISLAIFRTATRRSATLSAPLKLGSSRVLSTRSTEPRNWSVGTPAAAGTAVITASPRASSALFTWNQFIATSRFESLHLAEDVLGEQLLDVDRRLDLADPAVGRDDLVGAARADADVALADQALGLDGGDRVVLQLHPGLDHHDHVGLVVLQHDAIHPAHLDPRDLDGRARLEPAHGGEVRAHHVAPVAQEIDAAELHRHPSQGDQADEHEHAHAQIQCRSLHRDLLRLPMVLRGHRLDVAPDELLDDRFRRAAHRLGRADLDDRAVVEHRDPVRDLEDLRDLVAHHDRGEPALAVQVHDQMVDRVDQDRIQAGGRLLAADDVRLGHQGARDGHPLAHAPRDLGRILRPHAAQPHLLELLLDAPADLGIGAPALLPEGEGDVLEDGHGVEEGPALEDHPVALPHPVECAAPQAGDIGAVHEHRARVGAKQPEQVLEQHRLAPAAAPDHDHDLAGGDVEIAAPEHLTDRISLVEALDADHRSTDPRKESQTSISTEESTTAGVVARAPPAAPWPQLKPL